MTVTDVSVLGQLNTDYLAAASLATVWMNVTRYVGTVMRR